MTSELLSFLRIVSGVSFSDMALVCDSSILKLTDVSLVFQLRLCEI